MNHSLCCTSDIWKLTLASNVLNIWSKSQTNYVGSFLISLTSVMHWDSDFSLLNSSIKQSRISLSVFGTTPIGTMEKFIYQSSAQPSRVMIIYAFLMFSSQIYQTVQMMSHRKQCCSGSSSPFPLNIGSLMSFPTIGLIDTILTAGTVGTKCGLVRLPCLLFIDLLLFLSIELLGYRSRDLTSGTLCNFCTCSCS